MAVHTADPVAALCTDLVPVLILEGMSTSASSRTIRSEAAYAEARRLMPGGVSSPVRAFKAVGGTPPFIREARGSHITDIDGNTYIDYVGSYGPAILGHANDTVVAAVSHALHHGFSFGAPTEAEVQLASIITSALPSVEMLRFVNSGTEATMSAIRLARAATGREMIVKCIGCYHGHVDALLVQAGSGALTMGTPSSPGVSKVLVANTLLVQFNDLAGAKELFASHQGQIACFCIEGVVGNMGVVVPEPGYLQGLRQLCDENGTLLLIDEVMTGFRVEWGGVQTLYGVKADLTCLGKVIGGGLPVGAYGGRRELMEQISPSGPVYQAGTLSGNPLAMAAGIATLRECSRPDFYPMLDAKSRWLAEELREAAKSAGVPITLNRVGSMLTPFFVANGAPVRNFIEATASNTKTFATFFHVMLENGVYLPPSQYEAWFVSWAHSDADIEKTIDAARKAFAACA